MSMCDSNRTMGRISRALGQVTPETTLRRFGTPARELPSIRGLFCWALIVAFLLFLVSGCGRYREELESAKQTIDKQNTEIKRLTETAARLEQQYSLLTGESKTVSEKNQQLQKELGDAIKAKAALSAENIEMQKNNAAAQEEVASLKRENARLTKEVDDLKKRVTEMAASPQPPGAMRAEDVPQSARLAEDRTPCDAVIAFMKACEEIVRRQQGAERAKSLKRAKQQFAPRMKGAPEKAITAAENWVKEGLRFWDKPADDSTFRLLRLRNAVLEACGKSPDGAGSR